MAQPEFFRSKTSVLLLIAFLGGGCSLTPWRVSGVEKGDACWYGEEYQGRRTASGETFDMNALTAAHKTLPFNTIVRVKNLDNGRTVNVRVNDRGPFVHGRIIDLSKAGAQRLGMLNDGVAPVRIEVVHWGG
jgi:rare lipoprotein A